MSVYLRAYSWKYGVCSVDVELLQRHMAHGHEGGGVGALLHRHPQVGELDVLGVVRGHGNDLGALVAGLDGEVGVRRPGHRQVGAGDDQVGGVVPVGGLGHVGLLAPGLRAGDGQVAVPVVEGTAGATDQGQVAGAGGIGNHGHGGNRRETVDPVRAPLVDGVHVGGGDDFQHLVPGGAHETAQAAHLDVLLALAVDPPGWRPRPGPDPCRICARRGRDRAGGHGSWGA
jgi:hypothetical protein